MHDFAFMCGQAAFSSAVWLPGTDIENMMVHCGQNDGGIKRGDRADSGDDKAGRKDGVGPGGSGVRGGGGGSSGVPTADPSAIGTGPGSHRGRTGGIDQYDPDSMTVHDEDDPSLGITSGDDDWATNTGTSREDREGIATEKINDDASTLGGKKRS